MANQYAYGISGRLSETVASSAVQSGTVAAYVGTAPVNLIRGYREKGLVNSPVALSNLMDAQRKLGSSAAWEDFTLCEAVAGHFDNACGNIGPIYVINVLDPDVHRKAERTTAGVTFQNGRGELAGDRMILDTFTLADKAEGSDYALDYDTGRGRLVVSSLDPSSPLTGTIEASFFEADPGAVEEEDIIGGVTQGGVYTGLGALRLLYTECFQVANLIAAPGWSHRPAVYNAMLRAGEKLNGHWDAFCVCDIPTTDSDGTAVDTIEKAKAWRVSNGYGSERAKLFWPQGVDSAGRIFHLSTLAVVELMRADYSHRSVPMETCGNKQVPLLRQYFGPGSENRGFDEEQAKELTSRGICTAISKGGRWVLWGNHTAAYTYGADVDPRAVFDVSMRMLMHITNSFQREWGPDIDEPMTLSKSQTIVNREQEKLDVLVGMGALLGNPRILFLESENPAEDLVNGDFRWDMAVTPVVPFKSGALYLSYTDAGFSSYFNLQEDESNVS